MQPVCDVRRPCTDSDLGLSTLLVCGTHAFLGLLEIMGFGSRSPIYSSVHLSLPCLRVPVRVGG